MYVPLLTKKRTRADLTNTVMFGLAPDIFSPKDCPVEPGNDIILSFPRLTRESIDQNRAVIVE